MPNPYSDDSDIRYHDDPVEALPKKRYSLTLPIALLAIGALFFGQTYAANINIGGSQREFGQGIQLVAACSGNTTLTAKPITEFNNVSNGGTYYVKSIEVSNVPLSCTGVDFTLKLYGETGSALSIYNFNQSGAVIYFDGTNFSKGPGSGYSVTGSGSTFTVTFTNPVALAGDVDRLTLESGDHTVVTCSNGGSCSVGDTGPGGGIVFYATNTPFTMIDAPCGSSCQFLEFAPVSWGNGISVASGESSGTSTDEPSLKWCSGSGATNYVDSAASNGNYQSRSWTISNTFGQGYRATSRMTGSICTSGAGRVAWDLIFGGQSDWFLPSVSEMNELCKFVRNTSGQGSIGTACSGGSNRFGFASTHYWTSTESPESLTQSAWLFFMSDGHNDDDLKTYSGRVRPIRAF